VDTEKGIWLHGLQVSGITHVALGDTLAKMFDKAGASCERSRLNYADCLGCGFCSQGCIFDKKNDIRKPENRSIVETLTGKIRRIELRQLELDRAGAGGGSH
jgi:hypothetical protein